MRKFEIMKTFERVFVCGLTGNLCGIISVNGEEICVDIK